MLAGISLYLIVYKVSITFKLEKNISHFSRIRKSEKWPKSPPLDENFTKIFNLLKMSAFSSYRQFQQFGYLIFWNWLY